jgi:2-polyprenyl-3-methyl-5-hydroxy-6-metoxy-1,4-benzoquinol methylase
VTCFQVLEHVPDPAAFARKLKELGRVLIVSVPYKWEKGKCKSHLHDPVDEAKMLAWFEREPDFSYIATELKKVTRLIQVYEQ